ncbi:MAG: primase-helicase zinc-binding domain-containing protein, partial [Neisseria sp.]|nr:primase-helicase zinc-binding domain-containing protein [Neisseria sp.]
MKHSLSDIRAAAYGRWPEIHAALGIPAKLLNTRKHQPCPHCGGKDRFRYTDHKH